MTTQISTRDKTINQVCQTTVKGVLFTSILLIGNNASLTGETQLHTVQPIGFYSQNDELYTMNNKDNSISFWLTGYNIRNNICSGIEEVTVNRDKIDNLRKLDNISLMKNDWNGNGARAFQQEVISKVRGIITVLSVQPELFPTACETIQLEYEKENGEYLEIEVGADAKAEVFQIDASGAEKYYEIITEAKVINEVVSRFYEQCI